MGLFISPLFFHTRRNVSRDHHSANKSTSLLIVQGDVNDMKLQVHLSPGFFFTIPSSNDVTLDTSRYIAQSHATRSRCAQQPGFTLANWTSTNSSGPTPTRLRICGPINVFGCIYPSPLPPTPTLPVSLGSDPREGGWVRPRN